MKKIGIFCGGFSSEFDISIKSGETIYSNFPSTFEKYLIVVEKERWYVNLENQHIDFDPWTCSFHWKGSEVKIDVALIYIHGNPGENGKLQAFFELRGIPCVNSAALASELSFDKWYCNQFLSAFQIPIAKSILLRSKEEVSLQEIVDQLALPCFVKPADSGSSYGISKVKAFEDLEPALDKAFAEGGTVVIESFLAGTEVTCGVYRTKNGLKALPLTEIATENDFFDYEAKYLGKSQEITPARLSNEITIKVQETAKKVYQLLNLRSIARIDFMIVNDVPHVIEVNTTPGFSPASIVPQMLAVDGTSIRSFWDEILSVELPKF
jgi:D-alanine-D-alanine ligase